MLRKEYTKEDFAWTSWGPQEIKEQVKQALDHKKSVYEKIKSISASERTFDNTLVGLELSNDGINPAINRIKLLMDASPKDEVRQAAQEAIDLFQRESVDIEFDEVIYRAVKEYAARGEKLEGKQKKLLDDTLREYRRMGFDLSAEKREALKANLKKLGELSIQFSKNINDWQDHIEVTLEDLKGTPEAYIQGLKRSESGNYIVTLQYPDYVPFMENAMSAEKRKELAEKYLQKGGKKNMELLKEVVDLRHQNAALLGYATHADYKTETRTAKNAATVWKFLHELVTKLEPKARADISRMRDLKREETGDPNAEIEFYDIAYYTNKDKKRTCDIDSEAIREYFPFSKVKEGTFKIYSTLFSLKFEKIEGYPLWHEDVELYAVRELDGSIVSYFLLDMFPRANKYGHACAESLMDGWQRSSEEYVTPVAVMLANFAKPTADRPSLLSHGEVETFFHEFGHIMHTVLTKGEYMSQAGYGVAWDFVEAPSQMLEHWVWDKEMLRLLSEHYVDKTKMLSDEVVDNLLKTEHHMEGYFYVRQLMFGLFDMKIHTEKVEDIAKEYNTTVKKYTGIDMPEDNIFPAGFGHLMGYDAGYYGYLWSKVFAADMFTRFKKEGLLNPTTGGEYRSWILEKGSEMDELDLVRGFLGREPNNEAFLDEIGAK